MFRMIGDGHGAEQMANLQHPCATASNGALSMDMFVPRGKVANAVRSVVSCMEDPWNSVMR